jgi:hypothetical protein
VAENKGQEKLSPAVNRFFRYRIVSNSGLSAFRRRGMD